MLSQAFRRLKCHPANGAQVDLVEAIEHTAKETERFSQICAIQQVRVQGCTPVLACEQSQAFFDFPMNLT